MIHCLKTWPEYFREALSGAKPYEVRKDDRAFEVGDLVCLREWEPATQVYSGRELQRRISCITRVAGSSSLPSGLVVLGMEDARGLGNTAKEIERLVGLLRQLAERLGAPMPFDEIEEARLLRAVEDLAALQRGA